jgi:hypothetical protein
MGAIRITLLPMELRGRRIAGTAFEYNAGVKDYMKKFPEVWGYGNTEINKGGRNPSPR